MRPQRAQRRAVVTAMLEPVWRARLPLVVGALVALVAGSVAVFRITPGVPPKLEARGHSVGVARADVLVDSASSKAVDLGNDGSQIDIVGLISRARVLANLIATSPLRDRIAARAGVDPGRFLATAPSVGFDSPRPSGQKSTHVMDVSFNEALPIVTVDARAPTRAAAVKIAAAATVELRAHVLARVGRDGVPHERRLVVKPLGDPRSATLQGESGRSVGAVIALVVLCLWTAGVLVAARLRRGSREPIAEAREPRRSREPGRPPTAPVLDAAQPPRDAPRGSQCAARARRDVSA